MLTNDQIKAVFLECDNKSPDGMYADDVDVLEFARKLEEFLQAEFSKRQQEKCIRFVRSLNVEVAKALEDWLTWTDRSQ